MLGHDLEMAFVIFHENRLIIDGDIGDKNALQIYQNNCVLKNVKPNSNNTVDLVIFAS